MKSGFKIGIALAASVAAGAMLLPGLASGTSPSAAAPGQGGRSAAMVRSTPCSAGPTKSRPPIPMPSAAPRSRSTRPPSEICVDIVISKTTTADARAHPQGCRRHERPGGRPARRRRPTAQSHELRHRHRQRAADRRRPGRLLRERAHRRLPERRRSRPAGPEHGHASGITLLPTPLRAYDSRDADGPLALNTSRTVSVLTGKDGSGVVQLAVPPGATGALLTLTATDTTGPGFLKIYSAASPLPATSNLNFTTANENIAVGTTTAIDAQSRVTVTDGAALDPVRGRCRSGTWSDHLAALIARAGARDQPGRRFASAVDTGTPPKVGGDGLQPVLATSPWAGGPSSKRAPPACATTSTSGCWPRSPSTPPPPTSSATPAGAIPSTTCRSRASRRRTRSARWPCGSAPTPSA